MSELADRVLIAPSSLTRRADPNPTDTAGGEVPETKPGTSARREKEGTPDRRESRRGPVGTGYVALMCGPRSNTTLA